MRKSCLTTTSIIIALLFCCQMSAQAGQNSAATVHIDLDTATADVQTTRTVALGGMFDVDIVIKGAVNLKAFNLVVTFPQAVLEIQAAGVTEGNFLNKNGVTTTFLKDLDTAGKAEVTATVLGTISDAEAADDDGVLAHLRFKALSTQQADVTFSTSPSDTQLLRDNSGATDNPVALGHAYGATVNPGVGVVSADHSTVDATTSIPADGTSTSTITITAKDAYGNPIPGIPDVNVVVASTGTGNTIVQPTTATNASGQTTATMSSTLAESKTISATINGTAITDTAAAVFTTPSPSPSQCIVEATTPVVADGTSTTIITITANDAYGHPIPGIPAASIVVSSTGTGNTIGPPTTATDASGQTTATMKSTVAETKTISATIGGVSVTDTAVVIFTAGAPAQLGFITSPGQTPAMAVLSPHPQVAIQDASGNMVTDSNAPVTVEIKAGTGAAGATLSGTLTVNAVNGVATFSDLKINRAGTGYQLTAISLGFTADSQAFNITAEPALTIEKLGDQDPVDPNTEVIYTITYGNVGLAAAHNTVIVETLPADLIYVSSTGGGGYDDPTRTIIWPIGTLNAEDVNNTVTFTARVANTGSILDGGTITNSALTIDCDETEPAGQIIPETTTVNDKKAPETSGHIPEPNSIQDARNTIIQLHITDGGSGVDANTVKIWVEGNLIYDGAAPEPNGTYNSAMGTCRRVGPEADYTFVFLPSNMFDYEQQVDVKVDPADKAGNVMPEQNYYFYTAMRSFGKNAKVNTDTGTLIQNNPATITDSEGNIWIVWDQTNAAGNTDIFIGRLPVDANAFEDSTSVANDSNNQRKPAIAVDGNDVVYVAWEGNDPNGHWDIFVSASANGTTWSTPVKVDVGDPCNTSDQISPAIAIDRAAPNSIYVAWQDTRAGNKDIWLATSTDGISWTETQVTTDATDHTGPIVAVDPNNVVYVAWTDSRNLATAGMDIYGASSAEVPWTNVALVDTVGDQSSPAGAVSEVLHLAWVADANGYRDILYGNDANGLLVGASIIDPNEPNAVTVGPAVAITTRGSSTKVFACWEDSRNVINSNGDTDIYFAEGRSPFGTNILVNDDTGVHRQAKPAIGVDKNGNPYIVWVDNRSGNDDIYYAGSICLGYALPTTVTDVNGVVTVQATADLQVTIPEMPDGIDANDIRITEVSNPPQMPAAMGGFGLVYDFGPSGLQFSPPATIRIPLVNDPGYSVYRVFRYDPGDLTSLYFPWSEDGIHNPATKHLVAGAPYLEVQVDHFSLFSTGGAAAGVSYHHGDGGCALSPSGGATPTEFLLPFAGYVVVLLVITCADAYRRRSSSGKR